MSDLARAKGVNSTFISVRLGSSHNEEPFDFDICVDCGKILPMKKVRSDRANPA